MRTECIFLLVSPILIIMWSYIESLLIKLLNVHFKCYLFIGFSCPSNSNPADYYVDLRFSIIIIIITTTEFFLKLCGSKRPRIGVGMLEESKSKIILSSVIINIFLP